MTTPNLGSYYEWPDEVPHFSECPAHEDNQTGECTCEDIAQGIYEDAGERKGDLMREDR